MDISCGCHLTNIEDADQHTVIPLALLYPARGPERTEQFGPYPLDVARDATFRGTSSPRRHGFWLVWASVLLGMALRCSRSKTRFIDAGCSDAELNRHDAPTTLIRPVRYWALSHEWSASIRHRAPWYLRWNAGRYPSSRESVARRSRYDG